MARQLPKSGPLSPTAPVFSEPVEAPALPGVSSVTVDSTATEPAPAAPKPVAAPVGGSVSANRHLAEGIRTFYNSIGRDGSRIADSYYAEFAKGGDFATRANQNLEKIRLSAVAFKDRTGEGQMPPVLFADPAQRTGAAKTSPLGGSAVPPVNKTEADARTWWQAIKEEGVNFLKGLDNTDENVKDALAYIPMLVTRAISDAHNLIPGVEETRLGKNMKTAADEAKQFYDYVATMNMIGRHTFTEKESQAPVTFENGDMKLNLNHLGGWMGNMVAGTAPTLVVGAATGMNPLAMMATAAAVSSPGIYAEAKAAGLSESAAVHSTAVISAVTGAIDTMLGVERGLSRLLPTSELLAKAGLSVTGKTAIKSTAELMEAIDQKAFRGALSKVIAKLGLSGEANAANQLTQELTEAAFQNSFRDTKAALLRKVGLFAAENIGEGIGEGGATAAEGGLKYAYDRFLAGTNTSAGKGQFGQKIDGGFAASILSDMVGGFAFSAGMGTPALFRANTSQTAYMLMEGDAAKTGDTSDSYSKLLSELDRRRADNNWTDEQYNTAVRRLDTMANVAQTFSTRRNQSSVDKYNYFHISYDWLSPETGALPKMQAKLNDNLQTLQQISQTPIDPSDVAGMAQRAVEIEDIVKPYEEFGGIENFGKKLNRKAVYLQSIQQTILAGKPVANFSKGLKAIDNFTEGDLVSVLVPKTKTKSRKSEPKQIQSISDDGQQATLDGGMTINLLDAVKPSPSVTAAWNRANKRRADSQTQQEANATDPNQTNDQPAPEPVVDESWRDRVHQNIGRLPMDAFDIESSFKDKAVQQQYETALKGKHILIDPGTGEQVVRFDGFAENGDVLVSTTDGQQSPYTAESIFSEENTGIFRGVVDSNDVPNVASEPSNSENDTPYQPVSQSGTRTPLRPELAPAESEQVDQWESDTDAVMQATLSTLPEEERFYGRMIGNILSGMEAGKPKTYEDAADSLDKLSDIFNLPWLKDQAKIIRNDAKTELQDTDGKPIRNGLASTKATNGGNQTEGTPNAQPVGEPVANNPQPTIEPGNVNSNVEPGAASTAAVPGNQEATPNQGSLPNPVPEDQIIFDPILPAQQQEQALFEATANLGANEPGVGQLLRIVTAMDSPMQVETSETGFEAGQVATVSGGRIRLNLTAIRSLNSDGMTALKGWVAGKLFRATSNEVKSRWGNAIKAGEFSTQKVASSFDKVPAETAAYVMFQDVANGTIKLGGAGRQPSHLFTRITGADYYDRGNLLSYKAFTESYQNPEGSFQMSESKRANILGTEVQFRRNGNEATPRSRELAKKAMAIMARVFPKTHVQVVSANRFASVTGEYQPSARIGNTIYLNESMLETESVVHEYGHIWADILKNYFPTLHNQFVNTLKGSKFERLVNEVYKNLDTAGKESEMISQAIGSRGARLLDGGTLSRFTDLFERLFLRIAEKFNIKGERIATWQANRFFDQEAIKLFSQENLDAIVSESASETTPQDIEFRRTSRTEAALMQRQMLSRGDITPAIASAPVLDANGNPSTDAADVPPTITVDDLAELDLSPDQVDRIRNNYFEFPDGTINYVAPGTRPPQGSVSMKKIPFSPGRKPVSYLPHSGATNTRISTKADDLEDVYTLDELSQFAWSQEQADALFGTNPETRTFYNDQFGNKVRVEGSDLRQQTIDASASAELSAPVKWMANYDHPLGAIAPKGLLNMQSLAMLIGKRGSDIRSLLLETNEAQYNLRCEYHIQARNVYGNLLQQYQKWQADSRDLATMLGPLDMNGNQTVTSFKITKSQLVDMAMKIRTQFEMGNELTHFEMPRPEGNLVTKAARKILNREVQTLILTPAQSQSLMNDLMSDPEVADFADQWSAFTEKALPYLQKTYYQLNGHDMPLVDGIYWPLQTGDHEFGDKVGFAAMMRQIQNASIIKERSFDQVRYYKVMDAFENINRFNRIAENYIQFGPLTQNAEGILSAVTAKLKQQGIGMAAKQLQKVMTQFSQITSLTRKTDFGGIETSILDVAYRNLGRNAFHLNGGVPLKQLTSYMGLYVDGTIDGKYIERQLPYYSALIGRAYTDSLLLMGYGNKRFGFTQGGEKTLKRIASNPWAASGYVRTLGQLTPDYDLLSQYKFSTAKQSSGVEKVRKVASDLADEYLPSAMHRADVASAVIAYNAAEEQIRDQFTKAGQPTTGDEFEQAVGELFNKAVQRTHQTYDITDRAATQLTGNVFEKSFMLYQGQATKQFNRLFQSYVEYAHEKTPETQRDRRYQTAFNMIIVPAWIGAVDVSVRAYRLWYRAALAQLLAGFVDFDESDKYEKELKENMGWAMARNMSQIVPGAFAEIGSWFVSMADNQNFTDVPFAWSLVDPIRNFVTHAGNVAGAMIPGVGEFKDQKQLFKYLDKNLTDLLDDFGKLFGVSQKLTKVTEKVVIKPGLSTGPKKPKKEPKAKKPGLSGSEILINMLDSEDGD